MFKVMDLSKYRGEPLSRELNNSQHGILINCVIVY